MSGGAFDYIQYPLSEQAPNVEKEAERWVGKRNDIAALYRETAEIIRDLEQRLHCLDYLAECDYGEDEFDRQWELRVAAPAREKANEHNWRGE